MLTTNLLTLFKTKRNETKIMSEKNGGKIMR